MTLLNLEQRYPGCMQGLYGRSDWKQYNGVRQLFDEAARQYNFFQRPDVPKANSTQLQSMLEICKKNLNETKSRLNSFLESESTINNPKVYIGSVKDGIEEAIQKMEETTGEKSKAPAPR